MQQLDEEALALPHSLEAEAAVLGALLVDSDLWLDVADQLRVEDFYRAANRTIYEAMGRLGGRGARFDVLMLKDALSTAGTLEAVGGPVYLAGLSNGLPRATNAGYYARLVRDKAVRRELMAAAAGMQRAAVTAEQGTEALEAAESAVYGIRQARASGGFVSARAGLEVAWRVIERVVDFGQPVIGLTTGLTDLDRLTRGMQAGQLIVVAARPGRGKTAFAGHVARHAAGLGQVGFFELEMTCEDLWTRNLAAEARIDAHKLLSARLEKEQVGGPLALAMCRLSELRLDVDDTPGRTLGQVRSALRRMQATSGLVLAIIDYLQLMQPERRTRESNRAQDLGEITRGLKILAKELRVPILLLAQLNREIEKGRKRAPMLSDLAETGAAEKDTDQVWFVDPDDDEDAAVIHVAKNRGGPTGKPRVAYVPEEYRFADLASEVQA